LRQHTHGRSLASSIHPFKDIEGMNPASIGNIVYNDLELKSFCDVWCHGERHHFRPDR